MMPHDLHHFFVGQHVFVTGASGFIGGHVASLLIQVGAHVRALTRSTKGGYDSAIDWVEGDLLARDSIDAAMKDCRYVFHVAGDYRFWARNPREIFANNVQGTINLLETAKCCGVEKIVVRARPEFFLTAIIAAASLIEVWWRGGGDWRIHRLFSRGGLGHSSPDRGDESST